MENNAIILVDKPKGMTSFDVIRFLRKKLNISKMGHAGTLDPLATGLLIIATGTATKKLTALTGLPKTYVMDILLGVKTDSGDLEGKILEQQPVTSVDLQKIQSTLHGLIGEVEIPAPIYSAIKLKGKPLYKYARQGKPVEAPMRKMTITKLTLLEHFADADKYVLKIEMNCAKGTYARSVAEEIGRRLGLPATIKELRRTRINDFRVENAAVLTR
ncbi:tRNA pseudouridine(55) synthase TruB [Candidatus Falkowbacteria bacterium]|nr:tRNA pseudouridine(55) synthase TruB [Candidatus Falkowbacteria bacterium]